MFAFTYEPTPESTIVCLEQTDRKQARRIDALKSSLQDVGPDGQEDGREIAGRVRYYSPCLARFAAPFLARLVGFGVSLNLLQSRRDSQERPERGLFIPTLLGIPGLRDRVDFETPITTTYNS